MFITLTFTKRENYCRAIRYLMARRDKYNLINSGRDYSAAIKAPKMDHAWYVYFSRRTKKS